MYHLCLLLSAYAYNCAYSYKVTRLCHTLRSTRFLFPITPVPHFPVSHFQRPPEHMRSLLFSFQFFRFLLLTCRFRAVD